MEKKRKNQINISGIDIEITQTNYNFAHLNFPKITI